MKLCIFGAQAIALGARNALKIISPERRVEFFLVTDLSKNPTSLGGVRVLELSTFAASINSDQKDNYEVYIATPESVMDEVEASLSAAGFTNIVRLTSIVWANMQRDAFLKMREFLPIEAYENVGEVPEIQVYKMIHEKDKQLHAKYSEPEYMHNLQVGASLSNETISSVRDNEGENISEKNRNYCELTGLYWMWKNVLAVEQNDSYYGLAHYRRRLDISENNLKKLLASGIDVVLPYPMPYEPDIEAHHKRYVADEEWNSVETAIQELYPEYVESFEKIMHQGYMYNYNVILAKRDVLEKYCSWLFSILFRVEEIVEGGKNREPNRYMGYIAETLETVYFMSNRDKLVIAHTGCEFLV